MNDVSTQLRVQLIADQHRQGTRHIELHFGQRLLMEGEYRDITPGPNALDHVLECSPLMQRILRKLLDLKSMDETRDTDITRIIILEQHLIVDFYAALTLEKISEIFQHAAEKVGLDYQPNFGSQ